MSERSHKTIKEFCAAKRFSPAHFYNLQHLGRGPKLTRTGGRVTISPSDEDKWDADIAANPIVGGLRVAAEKLRAAEQAVA